MARPEVIYRLANEILGEYTLDSLADRIELQKALYLFQHHIADLNLHFNWYIYGPYSPDLTKVLFSIEQNKEDVEKKAESLGAVPERISTALNKLKDIIRINPSGVTRTQWLEALASVDFLKKQRRTKSDIKAKLAKEKPYLKKQIIKQALDAVESI